MYEIHVTFREDPRCDNSEMRCSLPGPGNTAYTWKYSKMLGDPVLEGEEFHYLTFHTETLPMAHSAIDSLKWYYDEIYPWDDGLPIRFKIEQTIYDEVVKDA